MRPIIGVLLLAGAAAISNPGFSQEINSNSGSNATSNSGSVSGAASDVSNAANNNIGTSTSTSGSNSTANSGSVSGSESNGNLQEQGQGQSQGQNANNAQDQGQSQGQNANNSQGQGQEQSATQGNAQSTSLTFEASKPRKTVEIRTNAPVGLAASSSFSTDYCGGTVSGGASVAPLGISLGGSAPKFDKSCQALRRAEKFGMAAANAQNMGQPAMAQQLMTMMIWSICTSDSGGPNEKYPTAQACMSAGLLGSQPAGQSDRSIRSQAAAVPAKAQEPKVAVNGKITPEAVSKAVQDDRVAAASVPR